MLIIFIKDDLLRTNEVIAGEVEVVQLGVVEEVEDHLFGQDYVVADHKDHEIGNMLPQLIPRKERHFVALIYFQCFCKIPITFELCGRQTCCWPC